MADNDDTKGATGKGQEPDPVPPEGGVEGAQASTGSAPPQEGTKDAPSGAGKDLDPVILAREREEAKREAAELRRKLRGLETKAEEDRQSKLTEDEKLTEELKTLRARDTEREAELQKARLEGVMLRVAPKYGFIDPSDALWLLDWDKIELDETSGEPTNLEQLLQELAEAKPHLIGKAGATPPRQAPAIGSGSGSTPAPPPNLTADELAAAQEAGLAPERYAALRDVGKAGTGVTLADWMKTRPTQEPGTSPKP